MRSTRSAFSLARHGGYPRGVHLRPSFPADFSGILPMLSFSAVEKVKNKEPVFLSYYQEDASVVLGFSSISASGNKLACAHAYPG